MRKFLISLLLASAVATPALAGPRDSSDRQQAREERQQARQEKQAARAEARSERAAPARVERNVAPRQQFVARPQFNGGAQPDRVDPNIMRAQRESQRAEMRNDRVQQREQRQAARDLRQSTRPAPNVTRNRNELVVSKTPRPGTQPPLRVENRRTPAVQWSTSWRNNSRYDWQNYRHRHRSLFHLGFYYDPFGWGYSPFQIGWRMWPAYYGSRYWINDPWMYRLPYAPPGYRWVRYWNDALLVDTWTGTVVDVIPGFFW